MKGALQVIGLQFPSAESHAAMRAAIRGGIHLAGLIAPENHFFAQARHAHRLGFYFIRL